MSAPIKITKAENTKGNKVELVFSRKTQSYEIILTKNDKQYLNFKSENFDEAMEIYESSRNEAMK
jgi:hypothetical protein